MFRRLREEQAEFLVNRLHRYCGARSLSDLKTIVLDSLPMSSSMVFQHKFLLIPISSAEASSSFINSNNNVIKDGCYYQTVKAVAAPTKERIKGGEEKEDERRLLR